MKHPVRLLQAASLLALPLTQAAGAIPPEHHYAVSYTGGVYQQTFDGLNYAAEVGPAIPTPNTDWGPFSLFDLAWGYDLEAELPERLRIIQPGMEGWQVYNTRGNNGAFLSVDTGIGSVSGVRSYGLENDLDRALGSISGTVRQSAFGMVLRNDSGAVIDAVHIAFRGEQWRIAQRNVLDKLQFEYAVTDLPTISADNTWTAYPALDFVSPRINGDAVLGPLDGNDPLNYTHVAADLPVVWPAGKYLVIRWWHARVVGGNHGMAVDDLSISLPGAELPEFNNSVFSGYERFGDRRSTPLGDVLELAWPHVWLEDSRTWLYFENEWSHQFGFFAYHFGKASWIHSSTLYDGWYYHYGEETWKRF